MATPGAEQSGQGQSLIAWAEEVNEATGGSLSIEIYPSGSLLAGTDILSGVADGRADLGMSYTNYHATDLPYWGAVAYPFVTSSWDVHAAAADQLREEFPEVDQAFSDYGVRPIASVTNGAASSAGHEPITSVSELNGLRYRAPGVMAPIMTPLGVDPVFMELTEAYEALQRGVLDGFVGIDISWSS
jgi:TRAP-type C4-dicarboxylate transport system substrate-binding protein